MNFKVGDSVKWTSSSNGTTKEKRGTVVRVVPKQEEIGFITLSVYAEENNARLVAEGGARGYETYLVVVPAGVTPSGRQSKAKGRLYRPRTSALSRSEV